MRSIEIFIVLNLFQINNYKFMKVFWTTLAVVAGSEDPTLRFIDTVSNKFSSLIQVD